MRYLALILLATLASCSTVIYPTQDELSGMEIDPETITFSLFEGEQNISEENIQRLLDGKIAKHDSMRVAIYKFDSKAVPNYYSTYGYDNYTNFRYNEEYLKLQQTYVDTIAALVGGSKRVEDVVLMPSLMVSYEPNITQLREAAVRLQADMLLIFSVSSDIYYKYKFLAKDNVKAFVNAEILLIDVRTGVIPFTSVITDDIMVERRGEELIDETRKRALKFAALSALGSAGSATREFLND